MRKVVGSNPTRGTNMRCVVKFFPKEHPPLLQLSIHDAPHRRMHHRTIQRFREILYEAMLEAGIGMPIDYPIDLSVLFVNPSTPDLGNAYLALEQAMDGSTLSKPHILLDDSLISKVTMSKFFPYPPKK
jgi:hypothetical protein